MDTGCFITPWILSSIKYDVLSSRASLSIVGIQSQAHV